MRGERRGFLLDRGRFGRGRCGGLVPLDRLRLARHRAGEHLVHPRDRNDLEVGIIGAAVASWLFGFLGITFGGWIGYLIAGFIGACILIAIVRAFSGGLQQRT